MEIRAIQAKISAFIEKHPELRLSTQEVVLFEMQKAGDISTAEIEAIKKGNIWGTSLPFQGLRGLEIEYENNGAYVKNKSQCYAEARELVSKKTVGNNVYKNTFDALSALGWDDSTKDAEKLIEGLSDIPSNVYKKKEIGKKLIEVLIKKNMPINFNNVADALETLGITIRTAEKTFQEDVALREFMLSHFIETHENAKYMLETMGLIDKAGAGINTGLGETWSAIKNLYNKHFGSGSKEDFQNFYNYKDKFISSYNKVSVLQPIIEMMGVLPNQAVGKTGKGYTNYTGRKYDSTKAKAFQEKTKQYQQAIALKQRLEFLNMAVREVRLYQSEQNALTYAPAQNEGMNPGQHINKAYKYLIQYCDGDKDIANMLLGDVIGDSKAVIKTIGDLFKETQALNEKILNGQKFEEVKDEYQNMYKDIYGTDFVPDELSEKVMTAKETGGMVKIAAITIISILITKSPIMAEMQGAVGGTAAAATEGAAANFIRTLVAKFGPEAVSAGLNLAMSTGTVATDAALTLTNQLTSKRGFNGEELWESTKGAAKYIYFGSFIGGPLAKAVSSKIGKLGIASKAFNGGTKITEGAVQTTTISGEKFIQNIMKGGSTILTKGSATATDIVAYSLLDIATEDVNIADAFTGQAEFLTKLKIMNGFLEYMLGAKTHSGMNKVRMQQAIESSGIKNWEIKEVKSNDKTHYIVEGNGRQIRYEDLNQLTTTMLEVVSKIYMANTPKTEKGSLGAKEKPTSVVTDDSPVTIENFETAFGLNENYKKTVEKGDAITRTISSALDQGKNIDYESNDGKYWVRAIPDKSGNIEYIYVIDLKTSKIIKLDIEDSANIGKLKGAFAKAIESLDTESAQKLKANDTTYKPEESPLPDQVKKTLGTVKNTENPKEDMRTSYEPRIKIEYKDAKTEKEVLIEKIDKMLDDILSHFDTSAYTTERKMSGIELLQNLLRDDIDLKLTAKEKELMKTIIVKESYEDITTDEILDNDKYIVHDFIKKYDRMTGDSSDILWVLRCLKGNNGLSNEQFNPFEVYNTLYKNKAFKRLSYQEINIVHNILTNHRGCSVEEQIERAKFDYREIANRDLVNLVINQLGLHDQATDYFEEFLYCTKEEFEAKIQRLNERPELIDNVKKLKFKTWQNLLNMPIEEYRKIVTPVENREGGTLDTNAYRRTIKTELGKPQPYDIQEALEVSSERNFMFYFGTRAYRAEKLVQFKPLEKTKTEAVLVTLPTTNESMKQLEQNGKVQIDIKNKGGLNPTKAEEPIIHPDDVSRLGQVEKAGIKIKYGAKTNWSNSKIARDIMQNFYDGNGHTLEGVNIEVTKTPEGKYLVKISGEGNYDYDRLESLGNSSKDGDSSNAGAFGEGTRIVAVNLLARPDTKNIKYACGEWEMNFGRSSDDIQTADMTQTLNKNSQKVKGNYIEFETADEKLVKEVLNSKDYFYQPYNKDFQNFDYENEFFGFKLLPNEKGNIYVVQRYETQDGIENSLENLSLVFKKMPNDPEITEKNDGQEFEIGTGRDRILLSERKIGELISRYLKTVPDEELMQTLATMKDSWIVSKEKTSNKMLLPLIEEAKSRKLGFAFEEPDAKTKKIMKAFGIGLKYMAVPEVASPNDIEMIRLMGYTPVIHELAGMGIQEFARHEENHKQPIIPTQRELQKLQLVSEAVGVIKDNLELENYDHISDKEAHAPTIIVEEGTDPNEAAEAILSNGELKGEWMTRAHLECERFTTLLSTKLHEITHKYGGDISSSFSDALVNLQVTIMKGLVHNPESLAKLRVLEDVFNEVDGKSVVENYVADGKFNALKFSKDIEKILSEPFDYVEYKEETNQSIAKSMSKSINIKTMPIDEGSGLLAKVRRIFRKSKRFYPTSMSSKYEVPTKKYEFEHPERQEYTKIETTLPTTNEVLTQLSESGRVEISIPNKGGMNPTNAENPIIHTDDISKLDKTLKAKIKIRYGAKTNWSEFKIARDIMQNFYDGNGHTLEGVDIKIDKEPDGTYKVRISGDGLYDYSHLESIGDSTKDGDFDNAGAFGEGTRIVAVNLLSHLDTPYVKYACGDWEMNFGRSSDDIQTADMTQTLHKNSSPVKGNYIEFKTGNEKLIQEIINSKDFFYHPENPDFQNLLYENEFFGIKVLENKEKQGSFYLVQKYETENPEQDMKGISIVLKKGDKDPEIKKAQGHNIVVRSSVETGRDRVSISNLQARELGRTYGMTMSEQQLVQTISALRDFYTLDAKSLLGNNTQNENIIDSAEVSFICGLVNAAASKHIQLELNGLKMASVSEFVLYDTDKISDLINRGYQFVPDIFYKIGIPDINSAYKKEHRVKSVEPTRVEQQKLRLINEAIQLFAKNDTRGTIPKITPDKLYIFDASAQKHTDIYAAVNDKNLKGLFVDRQYLENTDFLNCVTRMIASSLHVHGDDYSANYSYELTDLINSEVNTLMHKPEIAQKLRILKGKYDNLK